MQQARPARRVVSAAVVVGALAAATNIAAHALWSVIAPYVGFVDHVLVAAVGIAFAGLGVVAAVCDARRVVVIASTASIAQAATPLALGLQQTTSLWLLIAAAAPLVPAAGAWIAVSTARGELRGLLARVVGVSASAVGGAQILVLLLLTDPASWGWCVCRTALLAFPIPPEQYLAVRAGGVVAWGAVGALLIVSAIRGAARRMPRGTVGDVLVLVAGGLLGAVWVVQGLLAVLTLAGGLHAIDLAEESVLLGLAAAAVVRLLARRASRGRVAEVLSGVGEGMSPLALERELARGLGDPRLVLLRADDDGFRDARGEFVVDVQDLVGAGRAALVVGDPERPDVVVVHDATLDADPVLLAAVAHALRLWAENARLTAELEASLAQVRESRERIVTAADDARRRLERDLHDGTQQLLVSAGMSLAQATAQAGTDAGLVTLLEETATRLDLALAELRELASGIAPAALAHGSLADAVRELALRCPVPTSVSVIGDAEPAERTRATAYFVVAECLTNIAKHSGSTSARVMVDLRGGVHLEIEDDGRGGADASRGTGLGGLADRVDALGGSLSISSGPEGTIVSTILPGTRDDH